ncbi:MAG: HEAT repeat domain-containing protein [Myxococcota bacterium]
MQNAPDPLDRVVRQYRRDVNDLAPRASFEALSALEDHLGRRLPPGLRAFLLRHNGAHLLRGSLRLRATADIAHASEHAPQVVLFADGPGDTRWAFAPDQGGAVFGKWVDGELVPLHGSFSGWLAGTLAVIESKVRTEAEQAEQRFAADSNDIHQLILHGRRALEAGEPEQAEAILRRVTVNDPSRVLGWQYLGDALAITDRTAARQAWLQAFRRTHFPLRWPGSPCIDAEVVRSLQRAFNDTEAWELELTKFLEERVEDVHTEVAAKVVIAAANALADSLIQRGHRRDARTALASLVSRCHGYKVQPQPWDAVLKLALLEVELGSHDEAEALLRRLRRSAPREWQGKGHLLLGAVAIARQEPWAEDVLRDAKKCDLDEPDQVEWAVLATERALRADNAAAAAQLVEEARNLARRIALPGVTARVKLAEGDVARAHDRWDDAVSAWTQGLHLLSGHPDAEVANRLRVRLGDAAAASGDFTEAANHYTSAARGFGEHELVVREAWALLRLARVRQVLRQPMHDLLDAALARFKEADLAAGVAACDAVSGDPGAHLDWHLVRARDHARARYDAQRARPPWVRADADRPERRLGAHRLAIAACSDRVVDDLARKMDQATRAIEAGRLAPKDESVLNYIGAADLLSGHRSWAAAEVLLRHLMDRRVDGHAWNALQGAIARSPNAALVHKLLEHLEVPKGKPGPALAAAAELLGLRREVHAVAPLLPLARRPHGPKVRKAAVEALGRIGDRRGLDVCVEALEEPTLAEAAALSLLLLGDRRGLDFHGRALVERRHDMTGLPGEIVGRYGGPDHLLLLIAASDGEGPMALGALQGLGLMGDSRAVPTLLEALTRRDRKVVDVAMGALELITGHHEEDEPGFRSRWHTWWEQHAPSFPEGIRHREGRVFGIDFLLERMGYDDPWVRRTAYDELCILTGERLPFDADGPWRLQASHLRAWRRWWVDHKPRYIAGGWYLDGQKIG